MISTKLIQMIEDHSDQITEWVTHHLQHAPDLPHYARLPSGELRDRCNEIVKRLGRWLAATREDELAHHFEGLGRVRCQERIPLHEVVRALQILKTRMLNYIRDQGLGQTTVELYAQEELEHQVNVLFDAAIYRVVRGYESALQAPPRAPAMKAAG